MFRKSKKKNKLKNKPAANNNTATLEIDYEKLADAIVKAQQKAAEPKEEPDNQGKPKFFKSFWLLLRGKLNTDDQLSMGTLALLLRFMFCFISIIGMLFAGYLIYDLVTVLILMNWDQTAVIVENVFILLGYAVFIPFAVIISVLFYAISKEIEKSKDKHYVASFFSCVVSLAALIISLVALKS